MSGCVMPFTVQIFTGSPSPGAWQCRGRSQLRPDDTVDGSGTSFWAAPAANTDSSAHCHVNANRVTRSCVSRCLPQRVTPAELITWSHRINIGRPAAPGGMEQYIYSGTASCTRPATIGGGRRASQARPGALRARAPLHPGRAMAPPMQCRDDGFQTHLLCTRSWVPSACTQQLTSARLAPGAAVRTHLCCCSPACSPPQN